MYNDEKEVKPVSIIKAENIKLVYSAGTAFEKTALSDVSFEIEKGEFIGIIGHTGSGKSTLVQLLNGLLRPTEGKIRLEGRDIWEEPKKIRNVRFKVGMVFQYPEYQLFEETVYKDIAFGPGNMGLDDEEIDKRVREAASFTGLREDQLDCSPFELSGGEKRRAAIAGVISMDPDVLILDEPTAGLDPLGREALLSRIADYHKNKKNTVILVSHSMEDIAKIADRILVMSQGQNVMFDSTRNVFSKGKELEKIGLRVPQITKIMMLLKEKGIQTDTSVITVEEGLRNIVSILSDNKKG